MTKARPGLRIGCSGWQYRHWKGVFYPETLRQKEWFAHYAQQFDTVEINNTFYHLPEPEIFDHWREAAPEEFLYVLKFSRYGSHMKRLKDPEGPIDLFLERARRLEDRLGPILVQLPPRWKVNLPRLEGFLKAAPRRAHRWAFEFRDPSWLCEEVFSLLEKYDAALCLHDLIEDHPQRITTDWVYLRFHGGADYSGNYESAQLEAVVERIRDYLGEGLDVFAFFNNDVAGNAPRNAAELKALLSSSSQGR